MAPLVLGFLNILFLGDFLVLGSCVCRYDGRVGNMVGTEPFFSENNLSVLVLW